jgi:hypothetical protein
MCCPSSSVLADLRSGFDLRVRGPLLRLAGESKTGSSRERLSSYREPASVNPQAKNRKTVGKSCTCAPFRLLSIRAPRQAVLRTSSWLAPSVTTRPCGLPVEKTRDASDRCLPPIRLRAPAPRVFPVHSRHFRGGDAPRSLGLRTAGPEDRAFHDARDRFGGSMVDTETS